MQTLYFMATEIRAKEPTEAEYELGRQFGAMIRTECAKRGWSQAKLSATSDVSKSYINTFWRDGIITSTGQYQRPSLETIAKLAKAFSSDNLSYQVIESELRKAAGWATEENKASVSMARERWNQLISRVPDEKLEKFVEHVEGLLDLRLLQQ